MRWKLKPKTPKEFCGQFPEFSPIVLQLLYDRNLTNTEDIHRFFNCDYDTCNHDSFLMKGIKEASERIFKAIKNKEKIIIVGDYDADGVCGLTILTEALKSVGAENLEVYIPDREKEGYGLNMNIARFIESKKYNLAITIDCGISDREEIEFLKDKKINTIIIDHHLVPDTLPPADIIINPKQNDEQYPFKDLCAAGLAFKMAQALFKLDKTKKGGEEKWFLDLAAIATVADVAPLLDENRVFVKYGLYVLSKTKRIGLKELMNVARIKPVIIDNDLVETNLNPHTIGFQIAPRINVASRMDHANISYELLTTKLLPRAKELAEGLEQKNKKRQQITEKIIKEIDARIASQSNGQKIKMIFEYGEDWPVGILGIIAGKLADKYYAPAFIFSKKEKVSVCSARSIPSFNITEAINNSKDTLEEFGGHPQAAGLTVKNENLEKFRDNLFREIDQKLKPNDFIPFLDIDCELDLNNINWALYDEIERFAPFGQANPRPKFLIKNLTVQEIRMVGNGDKHLKLKLGGNDKNFKAIGFGLGDRSKDTRLNDKIDIVAELLVDEWNGNRELQLNIVDLKR